MRLIYVFNSIKIDKNYNNLPRNYHNHTLDSILKVIFLKINHNTLLFDQKTLPNPPDCFVIDDTFIKKNNFL